MVVLGLNLIPIENLLISSFSGIMKPSFLSILNIKYQCNHLLKAKPHHPSKFIYYMKSKYTSSLGYNYGHRTYAKQNQDLHKEYSPALSYILQSTHFSQKPLPKPSELVSAAISPLLSSMLIPSYAWFCLHSCVLSFLLPSHYPLPFRPDKISIHPCIQRPSDQSGTNKSLLYESIGCQCTAVT